MDHNQPPNTGPANNSPVLIKLTEQEALHAISVGGKRQWESIKKGLDDKHGFQGDGWEVHIEGAMGELAVAKALNVYWDAGINTFKTPDIGPLYVRTRSQHHYDLLIREDDDNEAPWVLTTGRRGQYQIHGWIRGKDAKNPLWAQTHGGRPRAYFVPKSALLPLFSLKLTPPKPPLQARWRIYEPLLAELSEELQKSPRTACLPPLPTENWPALCWQLSWLSADSTALTTPVQKNLSTFLLKELEKCMEQAKQPAQKNPCRS
jgi:hypothetical protein